MDNDVEHIFKWLVAICRSLEKSSQILCPIVNWFICLLMSCKSSNTYQIYDFSDIFPHCINYLFTFLRVFFLKHKSI